MKPLIPISDALTSLPFVQRGAGDLHCSVSLIKVASLRGDPL